MALALISLSIGVTPAGPRQELGAEATIRAFLAHLEAGNVGAAAAMVSGATDPGQVSPVGARDFSYKVKAARVYGDDQEAVVVLDLDASNGQETQPITDTFRLVKVNGVWKIHANSFITTMPSPSLLASAFVSSPVMNQAKEASKKTACLSNVKQLALATMLYASDYDDHFPDANKWRSSIMPYTKNQETFRCPEDKSGNPSSYRMNPRMSKLSVVSLSDPAGTVLIFEGDATGFVPRHAGAGNVAFTDGHAKAIAAAAYPKLRQTK